MSLIWATGLTTVPGRAGELLPRTLRSLAAAGFSEPWLFVDGEWEWAKYAGFGLHATLRHPKVGAFGNWALGLWELWIRNPRADRFAIFQDDVVTCLRLREYLEACKYPEKGYLNLCTTKENAELAEGREGWFLANQYGRGALGLIFDADAVEALLGDGEFIRKPRHAARPTRSIDGCVVTALKRRGYREWCHYPSLLEHTGKESAIGNNWNNCQCPSFPGEETDAMQWVTR